MAKRSKSEVDYRATPKGQQKCIKCLHFIPPDACEGVAGIISPSGWCVRFSPKSNHDHTA